MKIYLLKSNKIGSRIIRWGLSERGSHMGFSIWDNDQVRFFHSYGLGLRHESLSYLNKYSVVGEVDFKFPIDIETNMCRDFKIMSYGTWYDYPALAYFSWRGLLRKLFKIPLPKKNKWNEARQALCTEALGTLAHIVKQHTGRSLLPMNTDLSIQTPDTVFKLLRSSAKDFSNYGAVNV